MKVIMKIFILPLICLIAGIGIIALNIHSLKTGKNFEKTTATITAINETYNAASEDYDHDVEVSYTYNGKEYHSFLNEYNSSYKVGKEIEAKVNPDDPSEVRPASDTGTYISIGFGIIAIIAGIVVFFKGLTGR